MITETENYLSIFLQKVFAKKVINAYAIVQLSAHK